MASKPHSEQLAKDLELARNVVNYDEDYAEVTYALARSLLDLYEQLEAEQGKNAKLSALIIEQEGLYRDERKAWRKALDSAMQYVPLKDHDFIEAIVSNPASEPSDEPVNTDDLAHPEGATARWDT